MSNSLNVPLYSHLKTELEESVADLSDAHSNLPGEYYGRITKPVAYFLLAKLALNAEIYTDDNWTDGSKPDGKTIKFTVLDGYLKMNGWEDDYMGGGRSDTHYMIGWLKYAYNARGQKFLHKSFYVKLDSKEVISEIIYCEHDVH